MFTLRLGDRSRLRLRLFVRRDLRFQSRALVRRVGELAERIRQLPTDHEQLEALGDVLLRAVRLRERRNLHRVVQHERRLAQSTLHGRLEEFVQDVAHAGRRRDARYARHRLFISERAQRRLGGGFTRLEVPFVFAASPFPERVQDIDAAPFRHQVVHRGSAPRPRAQIHRLVAVRNLQIEPVQAAHSVRAPHDHLLRQL
mmetsp:Transcript_126/g.446  ORF Transcript_126/g.446 Transcript_126/m.446 type:complete len:200 (-) Transcript_126:1236-1835(-)